MTRDRCDVQRIAVPPRCSHGRMWAPRGGSGDRPDSALRQAAVHTARY